MVGLNPAHHCACQLARQVRILRIVFKIPAAQRASVDIHCRGQPHGNVVFFHLSASCQAYRLHDLRVPATGQQRRARPAGGGHAALRGNPKSRRAVRRHDRRNSVLRQIAVAKSICHPCVGLASQKLGRLLIRKLSQKLLRGELSFRHFLKDMRALFVGLPPKLVPVPWADGRNISFHHILRHPLQFIGIGVVPLPLGHFLIAAV